MKTLEELKAMIESADDFTGGKEAKFLSYKIEDGKARLHSEYKFAKLMVEDGGQVLVLANDKVYTYKVKTEAEYHEYLGREIKRESYNYMCRYGL